MRRVALSVALLGILALLILLNFYEKEISSERELSDLADNQKVKITGKVVSEKEFGEYWILKLDKGIEVRCECSGFLGENVIIYGIVEEFNGNKRIEVLKIRRKI